MRPEEYEPNEQKGFNDFCFAILKAQGLVISVDARCERLIDCYRSEANKVFVKGFCL